MIRFQITKSALSFLFALISYFSYGQQQAMYTQYMFNGLAINPAYAGSHESISFTAISRFQWLGIDGAPETHTASVHSPVPGKNIGIGLVFSNDQIGVTSHNSVYLSYSYKIQMRALNISMGLQGGFNDFTNDYQALGVNDPNLQGTFRRFRPNFGIGVFVSSDRFYAGVSVPTALKRKMYYGEQGGVAITELPHLYITSGVVLELNPLIKFKPSILVKSVVGAPMEIDVNANLILDDRVWVGLSYRSFDAVSALLDFQINPQLRIGYAYDFTVSELNQATTGSHEIMINYRLVTAKNKIVTPRYF
ncbi:MAG: type IX secretion system membrane protein PorP/SprF [Marinoscillum sp.]